MKKGAIFDMDGLLFDTERLYQIAWHQLADEYGVTLDDDFMYRMCGTSGDLSKQIIEEVYGAPDGHAVDLEAHRRVMEMLKDHVPERPGVRKILALFHEHGVPMAVASSSELLSIKSNLAVTGLDRYFAAVVSGANLEHGKPAPDIFLLAAGEIGVAPEDCYVFEDSFAGIRAGHAAGSAAVMIPDLMRPDEEIRALCAGIYPTLGAAADAIARGEI